MNKTLKKQVNKYCKEISDSLICPGRQKSVYIREIRNSINEMTDIDPSLSIEEIKEFFGTPAQIAESFKNETDAVALRKRLSIKIPLLIFLVAVILIYLAFAVISFIDVHTEAHGYFSEGMMTVFSFFGGDML